MLCARQAVTVLGEDHPECLTAAEAGRGKDVDHKVATATEEILQKEEKNEEKTETKTETKDAKAKTDRDRFVPRENRFTLSGALKGHESFDSAQDDLMRLLCHLRMGPDGCDGGVVQNPLHTRKLIQVAQAELLDSLPAQRKSRVSAWIQAGEKARKESSPSLPTSVSIQTGDVFAVRWRGDWHVALVLTTFRCLKKGAGGVPFVGQIAKEALHSCRVLILKQNEEDHDVYMGDIDKQCLILPVDNIGIRLDGEASKQKSTLQGLKLLLGEDCSVGLSACHSQLCYGIEICFPTQSNKSSWWTALILI